jgi:hypothetical protein
LVIFGSISGTAGAAIFGSTSGGLITPLTGGFVGGSEAPGGASAGVWLGAGLTGAAPGSAAAIPAIASKPAASNQIFVIDRPDFPCADRTGPLTVVRPSANRSRRRLMPAMVHRHSWVAGKAFVFSLRTPTALCDGAPK